MSLRILLIEAEPHAREGLRTILVAAGHTVSVAEDLPAGFRHLCLAGPFDLLLLDADLPPSRGTLIGVLDLLRLARVGREGTQGILITSYVEDLPADLTAQGVVAVLEKPVDLSRLRRELAAVEARSERREGSTASRP